MDISLGHVVLALGGVLVACLLFRYLKLVIHLLVVLGKVLLVTLVAFVLVYATGIWRPDLSPLVWLVSKLLWLIGKLRQILG